MKNKIEELLKAKLPNTFNIMVCEWKGFGGNYIKVAFSPNTHQVNNVKGQFPQMVSLNLDVDTMELSPQSFGCNGGKIIYREVNKDHPKERYLAMKGIKVPFRMPKKEEKFVLRAIEKFADNYIKTLKDNFEMLRYKDVVDYGFLTDPMTTTIKK